MPVRTRVTAALVLVAGTSLAVLTPGTAWAHAELVRATPADGTSLSARPGQVALTFSEALAASSRLVVTDGCGRQVTGAVRVSGNAMVAAVPSGQPGAWSVTADVVSSDDGHASQEHSSFTLQGAASCKDAPPVAQGASGSTSGTSGSTTTVLVLAGVLAVAGAGAMVVRRRTTA